LSHEEKWLWLKLSMEGRPWLDMEDKEGAPWGAAWRRARPLFLLRAPILLLPCVCYMREEGKKRGRKEKDERKGKKEMEKNKMGNFLNLKIFGEKNKREFTKLV
jgi:hypothetical protein